MIPILPIGKSIKMSKAIDEAVNALRKGDLVALPTETVYGLAGRADSADTVERIFKAKGRSPTNPVIVHVSDEGQAQKLVSDWPARASELAKAFWPGPLTLVLPSAGKLPLAISAGQKTLALRCPAHPIFREILSKVDFPLAAPSANRSGHISPSQAIHVQRSLKDGVELIVDGGPCQYGLESTILSLAGPIPQLLRPGSLPLEDLEKIVGKIEIPKKRYASTEVQPSPGTSLKHYSPEAKVVLYEGEEIKNVEEEIDQRKGRVGLVVLSEYKNPKAIIVKLPKHAQSYGAKLYETLHLLEAQGCEFIAIETVPASSEWMAVQDRLSRIVAD